MVCGKTIYFSYRARARHALRNTIAGAVRRPPEEGVRGEAEAGSRTEAMTEERSRCLTELRTDSTRSESRVLRSTAPNPFATSAIEIIRSKHLAKRKRERDIDTRDMQAAIKHGRKEAGSMPGRVKHTYNGVAVVTDGEHRVGITAFPTGAPR